MSWLKLISLLVLAQGVSHAAEPAEDLEFSGVMVAADQTTVHLTKKSTGFSAWTLLGQPFADYVVTRYDPKTETLVVTRGGLPLQVQLNSQQIKEAAPGLTEQQKGTIAGNLRRISAALDQYFLETGKTRAALSDLVGPEKYIRQLDPVDGEDYSKLELMQGSAALMLTTHSGATVIYDRVDPLAQSTPAKAVKGPEVGAEPAAAR